jgi:hypothetical protein
MALPNNQQGSVNGVTQYRRSTLYQTAAEFANTPNWLVCNDETDTFGYYSSHGSPNNVVAADIGSYCSDTTNGDLYIKKTDTVSTGWEKIASGTAVATTYDTNSGSAVPIANILNIDGLGETTTSGASNTVSILSPRTAQFVVDPVVNVGTHTTIASAITAASSGDTIFIRPGSYTENLTLKAGVSLTAFTGDGMVPTVTIIGTCSFAAAGSAAINNVRMQTNGAAILSVTGSEASDVYLNNCDLNCTDNSGITFSSSSSSASVTLTNCTGNLATTGINYFDCSSAGALSLSQCVLSNTGGSSTANTLSAGVLFVRNTTFSNPITTSGATATMFLNNTAITTSTQNVTALTHGSTAAGTNTIDNSRFGSGTASAISIGASATLTMTGSRVTSSNANAITGSGTLEYTGIFFTSSSGVNVTTQTRDAIDGGTYKGKNDNTAPAAGFIGEQIRSFVGSGSAVAVSTNTPTNVTSISLTPGIWDVSCIGVFTAAAITGTNCAISISGTSATRGTNGDSEIVIPTVPTASSAVGLSVPSFRVTLNATTTYYLIAYTLYTVGSQTAFGRISATRVA